MTFRTKRKKINLAERGGFTLIELLIVIAIIGILASIIMVSLGSARAKSKDGSFKLTARSVFSAAASCCVQDSGSLSAALGGEICTPALGSTYPDATRIGSVTINQNCIAGGAFRITVTPGTENSGNCVNAVINERGVESFSGC